MTDSNIYNYYSSQYISDNLTPRLSTFYGYNDTSDYISGTGYNGDSELIFSISNCLFRLNVNDSNITNIQYLVSSNTSNININSSNISILNALLNGSSSSNFDINSNILGLIYNINSNINVLDNNVGNNTSGLFSLSNYVSSLAELAYGVSNNTGINFSSLNNQLISLSNYTNSNFFTSNNNFNNLSNFTYNLSNNFDSRILTNLNSININEYQLNSFSNYTLNKLSNIDDDLVANEVATGVVSGALAAAIITLTALIAAGKFPPTPPGVVVPPEAEPQYDEETATTDILPITLAPKGTFSYQDPGGLLTEITRTEGRVGINNRTPYEALDIIGGITQMTGAVVLSGICTLASSVTKPSDIAVKLGNNAYIQSDGSANFNNVIAYNLNIANDFNTNINYIFNVASNQVALLNATTFSLNPNVNLLVESSATINSNLTVNYIDTDNVFINSNLNVSDTIDASTANITNLNGNFLTINNVATFDSNVSIFGEVECSSNLIVTEDFYVLNDTVLIDTIIRDLNVNSIIASSNISSASNINCLNLNSTNNIFTKFLSVSSNLSIFGNSLLSNNLQVIGNTLLSNNLSVAGKTNFIGNVGIGTTNPQSILHILGPQIDNPTVNGIHFGNNFGNAQMQNITMVANSSHSINFTNSNAFINLGQINYNMSNQKMAFMTNGSQKIFINSFGNLGIGNSNPQYNLDVLGNANITSNLYTSNLYISGNVYGFSNTLSSNYILPSNITLSNLIVNSNITNLGNIYNNGTIVSSNIGINNALTVSGLTTLSNLTITGNVIGLSNYVLSSNLNLTSLIVNSNTTVNNLNITGTVTGLSNYVLSSNLNLTSLIVNSNITALANIYNNGTIFTSNIGINNALTVVGLSTFSNANFTGTVTGLPATSNYVLPSNLTVANLTTTSNIYCNNTVTTNKVFINQDLSNLGTTSLSNLTINDTMYGVSNIYANGTNAINLYTGSYLSSMFSGAGQLMPNGGSLWIGAINPSNSNIAYSRFCCSSGTFIDWNIGSINFRNGVYPTTLATVATLDSTGILTCNGIVINASGAPKNIIINGGYLSITPVGYGIPTTPSSTGVSLYLYTGTSVANSCCFGVSRPSTIPTIWYNVPVNSLHQFMNDGIIQATISQNGLTVFDGVSNTYNARLFCNATYQAAFIDYNGTSPKFYMRANGGTTTFTLDSSGNLTIPGQFIAGNGMVCQNNLYFNNDIITWPSSAPLGTPSSGAYRTNGTRIQFYSSGSALDTSDYSVGMSGNELWHNVPNAASFTFKFQGSTQVSISSTTFNAGNLAFTANSVGTNSVNTAYFSCLSTPLKAYGYYCKAGISGSTYGNTFNWNWEGSAMAMWIDASRIGTVNVTSDRRIKENILSIPNGSLALINKLRPVSYTYKDYDIYKKSSVIKNSFIADELQAVIPSAVIGDPNGPNLQSLELLSIIAHLTKAVQELSSQVNVLQNTVATLTGGKI
jgi:hypothetical protein